MYIKNKKGQSTVEYILLVTAVVAVMIVFTTGVFKTQLNSAVNTAGTDIDTKMNTLTGSRPLADKPKAGDGAPSQYSVNTCPPGVVCK